MGRDVVEPSATAIETGERGRYEAVALRANDAETGVARRHRGERRIVIARSIADAARTPERAKRVAIVPSKVAYLHRRPY